VGENDIPKTNTPAARTAKVAVRFCQVSLRTPYRFDNRDPLQVDAVYACGVDFPDGATSLAWMLLTDIVSLGFVFEIHPKYFHAPKLFQIHH